MPTRAPTSEPSKKPTEMPTRAPTTEPSKEPTDTPTSDPTFEPSKKPKEKPTGDPTTEPLKEPTEMPTKYPTSEPSTRSTGSPTENPTSPKIFLNQIVIPTTIVQTMNPTRKRQRESLTKAPTNIPSPLVPNVDLESFGAKSKVPSVSPSTFSTILSSFESSADASRLLDHTTPSNNPSEIQRDPPTFTPSSGATSDRVSTTKSPSLLTTPLPLSSSTNSPSILNTSPLTQTDALPTVIISTGTEDESTLIFSVNIYDPPGSVSADESSYLSSIPEIPASGSPASVKNTLYCGRALLAMSISWTILMTIVNLMIA
mmetsp:Transcript_20104/g.42514  ORF Transcript_20104/g.42514 Transcript_20104/m.42514 type:complete len:315 (-) Transcript_20104:78-1022(-)